VAGSCSIIDHGSMRKIMHDAGMRAGGH
jgi:hypothetical protein